MVENAFRTASRRACWSSMRLGSFFLALPFSGCEKMSRRPWDREHEANSRKPEDVAGKGPLAGQDRSVGNWKHQRPRSVHLRYQR